MKLVSRHHFHISQELAENLTAADKKFIMYHCCSKLKFRTKSAVNRRVVQFLKTFKDIDSCNVYHCKFCNGWHFSTHVNCGYDDDSFKAKILTIKSKLKLRKKIHKMHRKNNSIKKLKSMNLMPDETFTIRQAIIANKLPNS